MNRIFCSPLTKLVLIVCGYLLAMSMLIERSHAFRMMFQGVFGTWTHMGFLSSVILFVLCMAFLVASVARTKNRKLRQEEIFILWRKTDSFLLFLFAAWLSSFLLFQSYFSALELSASGIISFTFAYLISIVAVMELTARIRDKQFRSTLYWVTFFHKHPLWKPLGFAIALLLANSLALFLILSPAAERFLHVRIAVGLGIHWGNWYFMELADIFLIAAVIALIGLTYVMSVLLSLSDRYEKANAEKIRSERFKSELITNVSHDIRTPLTSIINYVDLLKTEPLQGNSAEYIGVLDRKSARLKVLIDDLMEASKAGTGNINVSREQLNLTELIGQIAGEFDDQFAARDLSLVLRQPDEPVHALADSRHVWRTLENLFSNAAKYALPGTRVFAEIQARDDGAVFTLKNVSQHPIDELSGDALAEQFIRGDRARCTDGSGLGLYIAKSLIEQMGGTLMIQISGDLFEISVTL